MRTASLFIAIGLLAAHSLAAEPAFRVPEGFEVTRVAGDDLAHDIWCLTLDPAGRMVVGGPGYIKRLDDSNGDGVADAATTLATFADGGPQGLCYVGDDLYHVGPQRLGLIHADPNATPLPPDFLTFGSSGEHGAHAIVRGPDDDLYIVCGNSTEPKSQGQALDAAGKAVAGRVLRFKPPQGPIEVVAWGFRNPYDLAFTESGRLLTVDSDNERAYYLPWYAPTRLLEVVPGRGHGWILPGYQSSWNRPASFFDSAPRIVELGRGSPTGLVVYRQTQFPPRYRGGVFTACWTFGRIYFIALSPDVAGREFVGRAETFLAPASDDGFAPVDLAVTPDGDLLVAIGGRHTQGGVFRIRYIGAADFADQEKIERPAPAPDQTFRPINIQTLPTAPDGWWRATKLVRTSTDDAVRLEVVRALQIGLGDIVPVRRNSEDDLPGYSASNGQKIPLLKRSEAAIAVRDALPSGNAELDRELARLLGMLQCPIPGARNKLSLLIDESTSVEDDIHYLSAMSRLGDYDDEDSTPRIATALLRLHAKLHAADATPSREWPDWIATIYRGLCRDPRLADAVLSHPLFGEPEHVLFLDATRPVPPGQPSPGERILARLIANPASAEKLSLELVQLFGRMSPQQVLPHLRDWFDEGACRDAIAVVLARDGAPEDRARLVAALQSTDAGVVRRVAQALATSTPSAAPEEAAALIAALRRMCRAPATAEKARSEDIEARAELVKALTALAGQNFEIGAAKRDLFAAHRACFDWFAKTYPAEAARLTGSTVDWPARLAKVDWSAGVVDRGRALYQRKACARCHEGTDRLGPELGGIAARLARDDLFAAITAPSRDFTEQYETTLVVTRSGRIYQGLIVYDSPESLILRTGADTTVRVEGADLERREASHRSFMPDGLLDDLADPDLADLYAYLKTLDKK